LSRSTQCFGRHSGSDLACHWVWWQCRNMQRVAEVHHLQTLTLGPKDYQRHGGTLTLAMLGSNVLWSC
jgi:hypothetical protein